MSENSSLVIRDKIVKTAGLIWVLVFDEVEDSGVMALRLAIQAKLGASVLNLITTQVSKRYSEYTQKLLMLGRLNYLIGSILEDLDVETFDTEKWKTIRGYQETIFDLTNQLDAAIKAEVDGQEHLDHSSKGDPPKSDTSSQSDSKFSAPQILGGVISSLGAIIIGYGVKRLVETSSKPKAKNDENN